MRFRKNPVELLAPAGTWEALVAAIDAEADAIYLGGKNFNMRVHKNEFNFDDEQLENAIKYAHEHEVKLYITINNLISDEELPILKDYLKYLDEIKPDAILVQDFSVINLIRKLNIDIPLHASIMMNIHNAYAIEMLKQYGITRVVISREMSLDKVNLLRQQTGIEMEYFIHGDMCVAESGQCIHSGVLFGQSGSRGRCLKPCRWPYELIDEESGEVLDGRSYKFAMKDMCMYRNLPELIQSGIYSFKIEGRMRPPEFIHRIVKIYRRAIDSYFRDPTGYNINESDWKKLYDNRARDFTTLFAFGKTGKEDIGLTGEREPRFFSKAILESEVENESAAQIFSDERPIKPGTDKPQLAVRVSTFKAAEEAIKNGADVIYVGGEFFKPLNPWSFSDYAFAIDFVHEHNKKIIINTPRTTYQRECKDLELLLSTFYDNSPAKPDGVMVSNLGALALAKKCTSFPIQADVSFNLFNHKAAEFLKDNGIVQAAASLELSYTQLRSLIENSSLPIEVVVHGAYESMICDHNFPAMALGINEMDNPEMLNRHYALKDEAGEVHSIRIDQFGRNHIYFAKDLCLYEYLKHFMGAASLRIEAQLYSPEETASVVKAYRDAIDAIYNNKPLPKEFIVQSSHYARPVGIGVYRFRQSRNSVDKGA